MNAPARSYESQAPQTLAFVGLGVMGHPMAGHLARAGHRVTVYNRTLTSCLPVSATTTICAA
jgi:3-hydroxyisobutyrate dehydrogenase